MKQPYERKKTAQAGTLHCKKLSFILTFHTFEKTIGSKGCCLNPSSPADDKNPKSKFLKYCLFFYLKFLLTFLPCMGSPMYFLNCYACQMTDCLITVR